MATSSVNKIDYLKRYLSPSENKDRVKKKRKKQKVPVKQPRSRIIDDDVDLNALLPENLGNTLEEDVGDNDPTIAEVIDERPHDVRELERFQHTDKWRKLDNTKNSKESDASSDQSPHRKHNSRHDSDSDQSLPRKNSTRHDSDSDQSPPRKKSMRHDSDSDQSPPRKKSTRHDSDSDQSPPRKKSMRHDSDSDQSPPRKKSMRHDSDSDQSPPRKYDKMQHTKRSQHHNNSKSTKSHLHRYNSPPRKHRDQNDSDQSPPRRHKHQSDSDQSPPRRHKHQSDSDQSPPRRHKHQSDSDQSPPRRHKHQSDSDQSPPRRHKHQSDSDQSPPRRHKHQSDSDLSPPRRHKHKQISDKSLPIKQRKTGDLRPVKTLGGATAGLSTARQMRAEAVRLRQKEDDLFNKIDDETLGRNATTVFRKTGRKAEAMEKKKKTAEEEAKIKEEEERYKRWGKGLKQVSEREATVADHVHEMSKPLARYKDDGDLDLMLREQDREGDPMLAFLKKKKSKTTGKEKPKYKGPAPAPNRFGIMPGYRWDGVDRSNGFEKALYAQRNNKKAVDDMAYKWSTEDM